MIMNKGRQSKNKSNKGQNYRTETLKQNDLLFQKKISFSNLFKIEHL